MSGSIADVWAWFISVPWLGWLILAPVAVAVIGLAFTSLLLAIKSLQD